MEHRTLLLLLMLLATHIVNVAFGYSLIVVVYVAVDVVDVGCCC